MKIFFDTEFTGLHQLTTLISIGIIADTGETFYAEFIDYELSQVDDWIKENVIVNLLLGSPDTSYPIGIPKPADETVKGYTRNVIVNDLKDWLYKIADKYLEHDGKMEVWSDCLAYDWVLFCEPFGGALHIPECLYYIPFDLATLLKAKGIDPDVNREEFAGMTEGGPKHNALWDAKVIKACYEKLMTEGESA